MAKTVVIPAGGNFEKLVIVESRHEVSSGVFRRILSFVAVSGTDAPVSLVVAQNDLNSQSQLHVQSSAFVSRLADFSAPRLAVYGDRNPCSKDHNLKDADSAVQPAMTVAGVSLPQERAGARATATIFQVNDLKKYARGLSQADQKILRDLAKVGHGLARFEFSTARQIAVKQVGTALSAAVQIALEGGAPEAIEVLGARDFLVEYMMLAPNIVASVPKTDGVTVSEFPSGSEFPEDLVPVFPRAYNDWVARELKTGAVLRRFVGPTNRCDVCYEQPPSQEHLKHAGVFWSASASTVPTQTLRSQQGASAVYDTWLSRYLMGKSARKMLALLVQTSPAGVGERFVEQASAQGAFIGDVFCPAMEGYKVKLQERREKTIATLNEWNGWNEKILTDAAKAAGAYKRTWYQDLWKK